jgi:drug/metabolite transporter (DMT)-like permease
MSKSALGRVMTSHSPFRGVVLVLAAVMLFACMDTASKYLMSKFNVPLVATLRYGLNLVILTTLMAPRHGRALWATKRTTLVVVRALCLAAASFLMGSALIVMPVGETVAIVYLQGFGVMLAGAYFLKERVTKLGWCAAAVGFAGVLLIARPGGALDLLGVVLSLGCAAVSVVYILLSRELARTETTMALLFHVALWGIIIFALLMLFYWRSFSFEPKDIALLLFLGSASLLGHFMHTSAYRFAPASLLAPFNFFHIAMAVVLGWVVFGHLPDLFALLGIAMIAIAGAAVAAQTHFSRSDQ